jgi:hypothetical protein
MAKRLSPSRIAGISAWTAAAVVWGTAAVTSSAAAEATTAQADESAPAPPVEAPVVNEIMAPVPALPNSGLVIIRYTPVPVPEPQVIVQRRLVQASGPSSSTPSAAKPPPAKSSGS